MTRLERGGPADVVAWLGAVQAQDYPSAKWALALRMRTATTGAEIDEAFDRGQILRTHLMRPTWHFVVPADIRWMLELTAPRVHQALSSYYRQFELDPAIRRRATAAIERALRDGQALTRAELAARLARAAIVAKGVRLALIMEHAELEGVVCSGAYRGKQPTYALLASRAPAGPRLSRDEALAELTLRYFRSHGPATIRDFVWWSGLTTADASRGLDINKARHETLAGRTYWTIRDTVARGLPRGSVHLLPMYDEYLVAYRDRDVVPDRAASIRATPFENPLVIDGQVTGTWKTARRGDDVLVMVKTLRRLTAFERRALGDAAARYGRFLRANVSVRCSPRNQS